MAVSQRANQQGFTLIEVLVAVTLLTIGLLSVAMNLTLGLKSRVDTEVHSQAMQVTAHYVEPLNLAVGNNIEQFRDLMLDLNNRPQIDDFRVSLNAAYDANNNDLRDAPANAWQPPYTLVMNVTYQGRNDVRLQFSSTHVFVP